MLDLETRALEFATRAHASIDQRRKYTGEAYIVHPIAVAEIVRGVHHTHAMIAAAYLHDVIEDTPVTLMEIRSAFGDEVGDLVYWLTDQSKPVDGNREVRKAIDRAHLAEAPGDAQTLKIADLIDNARTISVHDPNFWRVYRREKIALLDVMPRGNEYLMRVARCSVEKEA